MTLQLEKGCGGQGELDEAGAKQGGSRDKMILRGHTHRLESMTR